MGEKIEEIFKRIELYKAFDSCGFEFADGFNCTFDNIAKCYDDRLELYELVRKQQETIDNITNAIQGDIDGFQTINEHGESTEILELLEIYVDILKGVSK